jgi:acetyl-CoA carboxylase carboxyltransferase component
MGPNQLSGVIETISRASAKGQGREVNEEKLAAETSMFREGVVRDIKAYRTSSVGCDNGVIDPRDTRDVLGMCLEVVKVPEMKGSEGHNFLASL